jgi:predicted AAA+ superfamily ATPase
LENAVYNQLKFRGKLAYYRKRTGAELDFVLDKKTGYEVKRTANQVDVKRVKNIQPRLKLKKALVISQQYVKEQEGVVFGQFV